MKDHQDLKEPKDKLVILCIQFSRFNLVFKKKKNDYYSIIQDPREILDLPDLLDLLVHQESCLFCLQNYSSNETVQRHLPDAGNVTQSTEKKSSTIAISALLGNERPFWNVCIIFCFFVLKNKKKSKEKLVLLTSSLLND